MEINSLWEYLACFSHGTYDARNGYEELFLGLLYVWCICNSYDSLWNSQNTLKNDTESYLVLFLAIPSSTTQHLCPVYACISLCTSTFYLPYFSLHYKSTWLTKTHGWQRHMANKNTWLTKPHDQQKHATVLM